MGERNTWALISIASIPLVMTLGNSMLIPVLPMIEKELSITSLQASLLITVYSVVAIFFVSQSLAFFLITSAENASLFRA